MSNPDENRGQEAAAEPIIIQGADFAGQIAGWSEGSSESTPRLRVINGRIDPSLLARSVKGIEEKGETVLEYDASQQDKTSLYDWLDANTDKLANVTIVNDRTASFASVIDFVARQFDRENPATLVVSNLDKLESDQRETVERQLLVPFLFPSSGERVTRILISDSQAEKLVEPILRWEAEVIDLIDHP